MKWLPFYFDTSFRLYIAQVKSGFVGYNYIPRETDHIVALWTIKKKPIINPKPYPSLMIYSKLKP
jgi:hypothetical protein